MTYDPNNIFARIIRGELPAKKIYEDEFALAFHDLYPKKKIHALVIPKGAYVSLADFITAPASVQQGFWQAVKKVSRDLGVEQSGYRLITNHGQDGHQEVPHFHIHLLGGESTGPLVAK